MGKKLLFILGSIFIGVALVLTIWYSGIYLEYQRNVTEYITNGDYTSAARYYAYALNGEKIYSNDQPDETHIEIFYAVNTKAKDVYKSANPQELAGTYDAYYKTIQISMFNVSYDFDLSSGGTNSKVIAYVNKKAFVFPFVTEKVNCYEDYLTYGFLNLSIYEDEFNEKIKTNKLDVNSKISSIQIIDDSNEVKYEMNFGNSYNFSNTFHNYVSSDLTEYNESVELAFDTNDLSLTGIPNVSELDLTHIHSKNSNYYTHITIDSVKTSSRFKTVFTIGIILIVGLDIGLALFIFKKKPETTEVIETTSPVEEVVVEETVIEDIEE